MNRKDTISSGTAVQTSSSRVLPWICDGSRSSRRRNRSAAKTISPPTMTSTTMATQKIVVYTLRMSQALGPAQLRGLTLTAEAVIGANAAARPSAGSMPSSSRRGFTLTTVYRPTSWSPMKEPPPTSEWAFAVDLLRRPTGVVHCVVPSGQRQEEGGHEQQQREDLDKEGEHDHGAAARAPERQQLPGRARNVQRDDEQAHDAEQENGCFPRLTVVQLAQAGNRGQPGGQPNIGPPRPRFLFPLRGTSWWRWRQAGGWVQFDPGPLGITAGTSGSSSRPPATGCRLPRSIRKRSHRRLGPGRD